LNIGGLSSLELRRRLQQGSLAFAVGSFSVTLTSTLPSVIENIGQLYADYPLVDDPELSDYLIELRLPAGPRRWFRPQVVFSHDGFIPFKPLPLAQAFAMFEWGLNWCVASTVHRYLVIHAAVVEKGGRALILPGAPGSGKSTLCAALVSRGWRLLSDEMTLIDPGGGAVWPFPRPVSLKNASIDIIRRWQPGAVIGEVVRDTSKGSVAHLRPPRDSLDRSRETAQPGFIVFPTWREGAGLTLEPMPRGRSFMQVAENSFNYHVLGEIAFTALADTVDRCECLRLEYSSLEQAVPALESMLAGGP
jgi:HprK-related kinase A